MEASTKKCVNGNCSIKAICGLYHQAKNTFEAEGANGVYARHSCRKWKCDHFVAKILGCGGSIIHDDPESTEVSHA